MDQLASYKAMQPATLNQLVPSSAPLTARPISLCGKVRAIGLGSFSVWTAPKQFPTDRRGAASQQQADRSKARPAPTSTGQLLCSPLSDIPQVACCLR